MLEDGDFADSDLVCEFLHRRRVAVTKAPIADEFEDLELLGCEVHA